MKKRHHGILGRLLCVLMLFMLLWHIPAHAESSDRIDLAPYLSFIAEESEVSALDQVISSDEWQEAKGAVSFGFKTDNYWIYVDLSPFIQSDGDTVLELDYAYLDFVDAYFFVDGKLVDHQKNGDGYPIVQRPIYNPGILFTPPETNQQKLELYLHIESEGAIKFPLVLWQEKYFEKYEHIETLVSGLFIGALLIMFLYHIFLFIVLKEVSIIFYLGFLASYLFLRLMFSGQGYQFLWPSHPEWNNALLLVSINVVGIIGVGFTYVFLSLHKMSWKIQFIYLVLITNSVVFLSLIPSMGYERLVVPNMVTIVVGSILSILVAFYLWYQGVSIARFFCIAWVVFIFGGIIFVLTILDHIPINIFTNNIVPISATIQMSLHALALADKFRQERMVAERKIGQMNEQLEERVTQRTQQLADSLKQLKMAQDELVQSEKMAALGGLVSGVAHEINTPLGVGISAVSLLHDKSEKLATKYSENELGRQDMEDYIAVALESTELTLSNLQRASNQISSFKTVAVDQSHDILQSFHVKQHIEGLLVIFRAKFERLNIRTQIECDKDTLVTSYPGLFAQLFTHLITNSIDHAFSERENGAISIKVDSTDDMLLIRYSDDGRGVSPEEQEHLFEPFYTTDRSHGHSGLGTFVIFNTVCHGLGGSIGHECQPNKGLTYHIRMPLQLTEEQTENSRGSA